MPTQYCEVCGHFERNGRSRRCSTCKRLIKQAANTGATVARTSIKSEVAQIAIRESIELGRRLHSHEGITCACYYSEITLETDKQCSSRGDYVSFDHAVPNDPSRVVLCSRVINDLKGLMTDTEFSRFVCEVLDTSIPRKLHGLTEEQTKRFLIALQSVQQKDELRVAEARLTLKELSSVVRY
jgi:hypothetical protein